VDAGGRLEVRGGIAAGRTGKAVSDMARRIGPGGEWKGVLTARKNGLFASVCNEKFNMNQITDQIHQNLSKKNLASVAQSQYMIWVAGASKQRFQHSMDNLQHQHHSIKFGLKQINYFCKSTNL
jgi:hypothetical protein